MSTARILLHARWRILGVEGAMVIKKVGYNNYPLNPSCFWGDYGKETFMNQFVIMIVKQGIQDTLPIFFTKTSQKSMNSLKNKVGLFLLVNCKKEELWQKLSILQDPVLVYFASIGRNKAPSPTQNEDHPYMA